MQIGFCGKPAAAAQAAAARFDYLELPVNLIAGQTEAEFEETKAAVLSAGIPTPAFNLLFPKDMALLSGDMTDEKIGLYLERAFERVQALGGRVAVFGSGKSRNRPEELIYSDAFLRLAAISRLAGEIAGKHGVTVVIEPLNRGESNMINSLAEGAALVAAAGHPCVRLLADYYHIAVDGEPVEDIRRLGGIAHAHIATKEGRRVPLQPDEGYRRMFAAMKQTGYTGMLSIEGKSDDLGADGPVAVQMLKQLWEEA